MKFSEMPYERPDMSALKEQFAALTERLQNAPDYAAARAAFLEEQVLNKHVDTLFTLASVRHTIDTRDKFYDEEMEFANSAMPQIQQWQDSWTAAMLASPYRKNFAEEYGDLMFVNAEIERKAFSPDIMEELQQENELTQQYGKLLASAQIPFEGGVYTLSQLSPFKNDPDDARRLAAWKAEGQWYKDNQKQLDDIHSEIAVLQKQLTAQTSSLQNNVQSLTDQGTSVAIQVAQVADQLAKCHISSPINGTVLARYAEAGELASVGKPLFKIADVEQMYLRAYITSAQLAEVKLGDKVTVFADYGDEIRKEYAGVITWISSRSEFTPKTIQTKDERANLVYAIKVLVKNDGGLKIGMYGGMNLQK